jgi:Zn-dependent M28 family amino/carboxypeptidase
MKPLFLLLSFSISCTLDAQPAASPVPRPYEEEAKRIITAGLASGEAYALLTDLTSNVGARLSGSPQAERAVAWSKAAMERYGFDRVWTEEIMVPHWVRGPVEEATLVGDGRLGDVPLTVCALGGSIATPPGGITADVVEVKTFDELRALGDEAKGKIVFFNRPMDRTKISTGEAYGGAVGQRGQGAVEAAKAGGVAALVRSMTTRIDDVPHTGAMHYADGVTKVPAAALSTRDADWLDSLLAANGTARVRLALSCETLPDVESANVIGELRGTEKPDEVIVIGGHLDSWDKGTGAHDDGAGCIQAIEALRLLKELGLRPKRTIRAVMFMNEENGLRGGRAYAAKVREGERHIAAMESDAGGFTPRGFGVSADSATLAKNPDIIDNVKRWAYLFESIEADRIRTGGGGADIGDLAAHGAATIGLRVDGHRYFDYHHSDHDTIDKVNERELELGAAAMAILSYVIAQEGL